MSDCSGGSCSSCSSCGSSDDPDRLPPGMLKVYDLNQSTADGVLVWIETEGSGEDLRMADVSAELLGAARSLSDGRVFGVVFGGQEVKALPGQDMQACSENADRPGQSGRIHAGIRESVWRKKGKPIP